MSATSISDVRAYEALDSRGKPTVACVVTLEGGAAGEAMAPSGASTGSHEALERRDGGDRYGGQGVSGAVAAVNDQIRTSIIGLDAADQAAVDGAIEQLGINALGANATIAVSLACLRAAAAAAGQPVYRWIAGDREPLLPMPMINIFSGGLHAGGLVDVQDFLVIPVGASSFAQAIEWTSRVRSAAALEVRDRGGNPDLVADEGGLAMRLEGNEMGVELMAVAIERAGLRPGVDVAVAIDFASTHFHSSAGYHLAAEGRTLSDAEMVAMVRDWCSRWPIVSVEDPLAEDDWAGWKRATDALGSIQVLGDDLFVTSQVRLARGIKDGVANSILIKVNQNGTVSGTAAVVEQARAAGYRMVVSARSGETEDSTMSDLAVGWAAGQVKVGSLTRSERLAKWNRLLRIEAEGGAAWRPGMPIG